MSTFAYGKHSDKRIGVWLRYDTNSDLIDIIKKNINKRFFDAVERIIVTDYDESKKEVLLEVWCDSFIDMVFKKHRYNVFYISVPVNEKWSCHGDLGIGLKK